MTTNSFTEALRAQEAEDRAKRGVRNFAITSLVFVSISTFMVFTSLDVIESPEAYTNKNEAWPWIAFLMTPPAIVASVICLTGMAYHFIKYLNLRK